MGREKHKANSFGRFSYQPLASQARFHGDVATKYKGFSGPIGSGKSNALAYEVILQAAKNPGRWGLIGAPTYPMLRDTTMRSVFDALDLEGIDYRYNKSEHELCFPDDDVFCGSKAICRTLDKAERLRGTNLAWFGIDELTYCTEDVWLRLEGRLRDPSAKQRTGFACWTPKGFDWVYERFIKADRQSPEQYEAVLASPGENTFLPDDFYSGLGKSYDKKFFAQEVLGQYLSVFSGQAYYAYDPIKSVRPDEWDPMQPVLWAMDFNVDPMSSVIAQRHPLPGGRDYVHVLDELVIGQSDTYAACEAFKERTEKWADAVRRRLQVIVYGDPAGNSRMHSGETDFRIVKQFFSRHSDLYDTEYRIDTKHPAVRDRVNAVNGMLANAAGERRLFHHPRCRELAKDFQQVVYIVDSSGNTIPDLDKSDKKRTHISDALGYLIEKEFPIKKVGSAYGREILPL